MLKYLGNKTIHLEIEEVLKDVDVEKVSFINDAANNLNTVDKCFEDLISSFDKHNTTKYGLAPFSRHIFKEDLPKEIIDLVESLGFTEYGCNLLTQHPGECSPLHYDLFLYQRNEIHKNTTKEDYYRYFIFLDDRAVGQFYHIGDKQLDWKAGDMYYQDSKEYHCAGNISSETRYTIIIDSLKSLHPFDYQEVVV
jgi:hypothetical protein|tara:strand:- start:91 stop:675 length:585 start_codon:yes stop_codon:yes gene_type:complete